MSHSRHYSRQRKSTDELASHVAKMVTATGAPKHQVTTLMLASIATACGKLCSVQFRGHRYHLPFNVLVQHAPDRTIAPLFDLTIRALHRPRYIDTIENPQMIKAEQRKAFSRWDANHCSDAGMARTVLSRAFPHEITGLSTSELSVGLEESGSGFVRSRPDQDQVGMFSKLSLDERQTLGRMLFNNWMTEGSQNRHAFSLLLSVDPDGVRYILKSSRLFSKSMPGPLLLMKSEESPCLNYESIKEMTVTLLHENLPLWCGGEWQMKLDAKAENIIIHTYRQICCQVEEPRILVSLKWVELFLVRLTGIIGLILRSSSSEVLSESIAEKACKLGERLITEHLELLTPLLQDDEQSNLSHYEHLLYERIREREPITRRQLQRSMHRANEDNLDMPLESLIEKGLVEQMESSGECRTVTEI